jgi:hypothetical protein
MILMGYITIAAGIYSYHHNRGLPLTLVYAHLAVFGSVLIALEFRHQIFIHLTDVKMDAS